MLNKFEFYSTQKSGTHLMLSLFSELRVKPENKNIYLMSYLRDVPEKEVSKYFNEKTKYIVTYRDPRDWLVSLINWMSTDKFPNFYSNVTMQKKIIKWAKLPMIAKLKYALFPSEEQKQIYPPSRMFDPRLDAMNGVKALKKLNLNNVLIIKFADLVGETYGGSSKEVQHATVKKIVDFIGLTFSATEVDELISKVVGSPTCTLTSKKKKVGQWKDAFNPAIADLFKKKYNNYILYFGFEKNKNWNELFRQEFNDRVNHTQECTSRDVD